MRIRFAPSPTGYLHEGGARTAIFNWLLARQQNGVLLLRIEDTDRERSSEEHNRVILDGMSWLGLTWEGPVFQSDGVERHRADALRLLAEGKAYRDFSDPEAVRDEAKERSMHPSRVAREKADELGLEEAMGLAQVSRFKHFQTGQMIYQQGTQGGTNDSIFLIAEGSVTNPFTNSSFLLLLMIKS